MKSAGFGLAAVLLVASAAPTNAQPPERGPRGERMKALIERFDEDGDGQLSEEERAAAREEMRARRAERGEDAPRRAGGRRRGPGNPGDRLQRPDPEELFDKFDEDGDGQLTKAEFVKLVEHMRANRPGRPPQAGRPGGPRRGGPGGPPGPRGRRPGPPAGGEDPVNFRIEQTL